MFLKNIKIKKTPLIAVLLLRFEEGRRRGQQASSICGCLIDPDQCIGAAHGLRGLEAATSSSLEFDEAHGEIDSDWPKR